MSVSSSYQKSNVPSMGGADMLIYLLHLISTPSGLPTRGSAIPSVSIRLADHHLTQLPAQSIESSAAGQRHPGIASRIPLDKRNEDRTRRHPGKAEPGDNPLVCHRSSCRADRHPGPTTPFRAPHRISAELASARSTQLGPSGCALAVRLLSG
ncbi:hypothetical protein ACSBR2_024252 [Camellia fascicularis]